MSGKWAETPRSAYGPLTALGIIALVTAAWWALALWPHSADASGWLARTRATCFGAVGQGLPDTAGWLALVVQPTLLLGLQLVIWGTETRVALVRLARGARGRAGLGFAAVALLAGLGLAGQRIAAATGVTEDAAPATLPLQGEPIDQPAPPLRLVDQHGRGFDLRELRGRTIFVTFAFAHCATACPLIVSDAIAARAALPEPAPVIVVVTLDPWRDTPARLPALAGGWRLEGDDRALGGTVEDVTRALDDWDVARFRDPRTGDLVHTPVTYVVDAAGRIAWRTDGSAASLVALGESP